MLKNNIKISVRSLWKHKLTTVLNVLGLTIGISCFMIIMIWVNNEKSFDSFHSKADRIYRISNTFTSESEQFSQAPSGPALGAQLHKLYAQVENGVRVGNNSAQIRVGDNNYFENNMAIVDASFSEVFDFKVLRGVPSDFFKEINSLVITESIAKKYFGSDDPIGKLVTMDGQFPMTITGLMEDPPSNSQIQFDMLISMEFVKSNWNQPNMDDNWGGGWFHTYLLLEDGVDPKVLQEDITRFIKDKLTWFTERNMSYAYFLQPIKSIHLESNLRYDFGNNGSTQNVSIFTAVAIIVLLLACINYINLTTANAVKRSKEIGIKKVMGALRKQLFAQYLVESVLVVLFATALSIGIVYLSLPQFESFIGYTIPFEPGTVLIGIVVMSVIILGVVSGLFPAATISSFKSLDVMRGKLSSGSKGGRIRKALVIFQFTATVILIISIITVSRQMNFILNQDLGMATHEVIAINFRGIQEVRDNSQVLTDRLLENPQIKAVSFQRRAYPVGGLSNGTTMVETGDGNKVSSSLYHMWVDTEFDDAFGLEMVAGRFFSKDFPTDTLQAIVVNEAAVESFGWGQPEDAIGKEMGGQNVRRVIGVVKNFNFEGLHKQVEALRILPALGNNYGTMAIRADLSNPYDLLRSIEDTWAEINPTVPLDYSFMNDDIKDQYETVFSFRSIFFFFSTLSIVIACLGLFGLATSATNQRIKEIGIRKVLGASTSGLIQMISTDFLKLVVLSSILAAPIAWYGMEEWLSSFAYRISVSWIYFVGAGILAVLVSMLTVSYQAIRAAYSNPTKSLRQE